MEIKQTCPDDGILGADYVVRDSGRRIGTIRGNRNSYYYEYGTGKNRVSGSESTLKGAVSRLLTLARTAGRG